MLLASVQVYGFQDYDIDGVEDSMDRCPNTPFDAIVDKYGSDSTFSLFVNYRYKDWDIILTNI